MNTDAPLLLHSFGCHCALHARRRLGAGLIGGAALLALPAWAREGVEVGRKSLATGLISAEQIEQAAQQEYRQLLQQATAAGVLAGAGNPQLGRMRAIAQRIVPYTYEWNGRARQWRWEINLIKSDKINAFCMPGGKIAFFTAILDNLKLTDDEVAMVMGHEMAHALREHARERIGKNLVTRGTIELGAAFFGLGNGGRLLAGMGGQLLTLSFGRDDESEGDLIGMELAARAGYDPRAGVTLWQKMGAASKNAPPQWISTHPSGPTRIRDIEVNLPKVTPLYARADKPAQRFDAPR
jgi:predicted Zn-dependent protease